MSPTSRRLIGFLQGEMIRGKFERVNRTALTAASTKDPHWSAPVAAAESDSTDDQLGEIVKGQNQGLKALLSKIEREKERAAKSELNSSQ